MIFSIIISFAMSSTAFIEIYKENIQSNGSEIMAGKSELLVTKQLAPIAKKELSLKSQSQSNIASRLKHEPAGFLLQSTCASSKPLSDVLKFNYYDQCVGRFQRNIQDHFIFGSQHISTDRFALFDGFLDGDSDILGRGRTHVDENDLTTARRGLAFEDREPRSTAPKFLDLADETGQRVQRRNQTEDKGDKREGSGHASKSVSLSEAAVETESLTNRIMIELLLLICAWGWLFHIIFRTGAFSEKTRILFVIGFLATSIGIAQICARVAELLGLL